MMTSRLFSFAGSAFFFGEAPTMAFCSLLSVCSASPAKVGSGGEAHPGPVSPMLAGMRWNNGSPCQMISLAFLVLWIAR